MASRSRARVIQARYAGTSIGSRGLRHERASNDGALQVSRVLSATPHCSRARDHLMRATDSRSPGPSPSHAPVASFLAMP